MNKNLYRAVRKDNNELVEGSLVIFDDEHVFIMPRVESVSTPDYAQVFQLNAIMVYPDTVCQCIGQKDKNGKFIFEGDILRTRSDIIVKVVFISNIGFCGFYAVPIEGFEYLVPLSSLYFECEVIGSIHCNKEK